MVAHNDLWKPPSDLVSKIYDHKAARIRNKKVTGSKNRSKKARDYFLEYFKLHDTTTNAVLCDKISKIINVPMPGQKSGYWKYMRKAKVILNRANKPKLPARKYTSIYLSAKEFYSSKAWRELRYIALKNSQGCCNLCGAKACDGVQIHVDHIKPRSKYPELALDLDNLQVLCEDCNIGKSNYDDTNWKQHWASI